MANRQELIKKYWAEQLNEQERAWLMEDLRRNPTHPAYEPILQHLWKEAASEAPLTSVRSRQLEAAFQAKRNAQRGKIRQLIWYRAAVVSGLVLTAALVWFLLKADSLTEYATDYGEIRTLTLPDSSRVTLNANSAIHYAAKWDVDVAREVWLDGEAYFSVTHTQNDQPFIVHVTDGLRVNVLGTEFNVKERRNEAEVVLYRGSVNLTMDRDNAGEQTLAMKPGELIAISPDNRQVARKSVNTVNHQAWRDQKMIFEKISLQQIARQLEDIYGITIQIKDSRLAETRLTGAFPAHNLETVLVSLQTIIPLKIVRDKNHIILQSNQ